MPKWPHFGQDLTRLQCTVQRVTLEHPHHHGWGLFGHGHHHFGWMVGRTEMLYVEIMPTGKVGEAKRTATGLPLAQQQESTENEKELACRHLVWTWGRLVPHATSGGAMRREGEQLAFDVYNTTEMSLRVLKSHKDWLSDVTPVVPLGEAKFRVDLDVIPALYNGGDLSLPLVHNCRIHGHILLNVVQLLRGDMLSQIERWFSNVLCACHTTHRHKPHRVLHRNPGPGQHSTAKTSNTMNTLSPADEVGVDVVD